MLQVALVGSTCRNSTNGLNRQVLLCLGTVPRYTVPYLLYLSSRLNFVFDVKFPCKQVFLPHVQRTLPTNEVKVLLGDNLAAHLSPYVTSLCEKNNIRLGTGTYIGTYHTVLYLTLPALYCTVPTG
jgi:hypothetical protein